MATKDYYKVLGVPKDATEKTIRGAYKKLARRYHPDVNPGDRAAEERFKEIAEAYAVLGNPEKRAEYDRRGPEGFSLGFDPSEIFRRARAGGFEGFEPGGFGFSDLGSIFGDLFRGGGGRRGAPGGAARGSDAEASLTIDFEDAVRGVTLPLQVSRSSRCKTCQGSGHKPGGKPSKCPGCGGTGRRQVAEGPIQLTTTCDRCGGSGKEPGPPCDRCGGSGLLPGTETIHVRIPAGVDEGSRVRISGKGEAGRGGGPAGDLYVVIRIRPHPVFRREGHHLICEAPLTLDEAALGAKINLRTLDGTATMTIPPGTRSGQRFRLRGKGAPNPGNAGRGDLFVDVQIVPPKELDEESRELLRSFAKRNPQPDLRQDPRNRG